MPPATTDESPTSGPPVWRQVVDGVGRQAVVVAVIVGLLVGAVTFGLAGSRNPSYVASAATLLDQPSALAASQDAGVVDKLSRLRLKYAGVLRSDAVVDEVARQVKRSRAAVAASIVTTADGASLLLFVSARDATAQGSVRLANALAGALAAYVTREQRPFAPQDRLSLKIVAPARNGVQLLPTSRQQLVAGVGGGLIAAVFTLAVYDVVRRRRA